MIEKKPEIQSLMNIDKCKGKVALITDACSSIGSELCRGLAKSGQIALKNELVILE